MNMIKNRKRKADSDPTIEILLKALQESERKRIKAETSLEKIIAKIKKKTISVEKKLAKKLVKISSFLDKVKEGAFLDRAAFLKAIDAADFTISNYKQEKKVLSTSDFVNDVKSMTSKTGELKMSNFHWRMVNNTADHLNVKLLSLTSSDFKKAALIITGFTFKKFESWVEKETRIIDKIRNVLCWHNINRSYSMNEATVQMFFTLYWDGLFKSVNSNWNIFGVNTIHLKADVEVNVTKTKKSRGLKYKRQQVHTLSMVGHSDVSIACNQQPDTFEPVDILDPSSVNGEIRKKFDTLASYKSQINSCRSQVFALDMTLAKMRKNKGRDCTLVKSFLSDFNLFSIILRVEKGDKVHYLISGQLTSSSDILFGKLFLLQDFTAEQIDDLLTNATVVDPMELGEECENEGDIDGEKENDNDNSNSSNQFHRKRDVILMDDDSEEKERVQRELRNLVKWDLERRGLSYLGQETMKAHVTLSPNKKLSLLWR